MRHTSFEQNEIKLFRQRLAEYEAGENQEKYKSMENMLAEISETPNKFRQRLYEILHGDQGLGAKLVAVPFADNTKERQKLFNLTAETAYMTGARFAAMAWDMMTPQSQEFFLSMIDQECVKYQRAFLGFHVEGY